MKISLTTDGVWFGDQVISDIDETLQKSSFRTASRIEQTAKALVSVGPGDPMHLRDTIRAVPARREKWKPAAFVFAGDRDRGVYWHWMVEFGTYFKKAHPFLRPAADRNFNAGLADAAHATQRVVNARRRAGDKARRIGMGKKR